MLVGVELDCVKFVDVEVGSEFLCMRGDLIETLLRNGWLAENLSYHTPDQAWVMSLRNLLRPRWLA